MKNPITTHLPDVTLLTAILLLGTVILTYITANICLASNWLIRPILFPLVIIINFAVVWMMYKPQWRAFRKSIATYVLFLTASLVFAIITTDFSWDGNMYHQEIIALLMNGWNPFSIAELSSDHTLWTNHYAKALETIASAISCTFGNIEIGKAVNYLLFFSIALLCQHCVQLKFPNFSRWKQIALSIAISANPVIIAQILTYYIDYSKYVYLLWTIFLIYRITIAKRLADSLLLLGVTILAIGTKFNIFFEQGLWLIVAAIWLWFKHFKSASKRIIVIGIIGFFAGVICAYHPYITNIHLAGHPLYPLLGENSVDIMSVNTPDVYGDNRIFNFFFSIFSFQLIGTDSRIGGFGPFGCIVFILSLYIIIKTCKRVNSSYIFIFVCTLLSCFIFEQSWWARYIAQWWLLPSIALFIGMQHDNVKYASKILLTCIILNIPLCFVRGVLSAGEIQLFRNSLSTTLANDSVMLVNSRIQFEMLLNDRNIHFTKTDTIPSEFKGDVVFLYGKSQNNSYPYYPLLLLNEQQAICLRQEMTDRFLNYKNRKYSTIE